MPDRLFVERAFGVMPPRNNKRFRPGFPVFFEIEGVRRAGLVCDICEVWRLVWPAVCLLSGASFVGWCEALLPGLA